MEQKQIRSKRSSIERKIEKLEHELKKVQTICAHPEAIRKFEASEGNYDRTLDKHWIEFKCPDCDKRWRTEQ
jgi:hypothetical protein